MISTNETPRYFDYFTQSQVTHLRVLDIIISRFFIRPTRNGIKQSQSSIFFQLNRLRGVHTAYDVVSRRQMHMDVRRRPSPTSYVHVGPMQIIMPTNYKMATEHEVYDVVLASSIVIFRLLPNFLVVEIDKLDLDASGLGSRRAASSR